MANPRPDLNDEKPWYRKWPLNFNIQELKTQAVWQSHRGEMVTLDYMPSAVTSLVTVLVTVRSDGALVPQVGTCMSNACFCAELGCLAAACN